MTIIIDYNWNLCWTQMLGEFQQEVATVDKNIIATNKMRNNFCYPFSYRSSNFTIAKVVAFNLFA